MHRGDGVAFENAPCRRAFCAGPRAARLAGVSRLDILLLAPGAAIGREKLRQWPRPRHKGLWRWRDALFILMSNNTLDATEFFRIPPNRGVELGGQIEI